MRRAGLFLLELQTKQVGEKVVITKPLAAIIQTNQEKVRALELLEHFVTALVLRECVAERAVETREHRSAQQKVLDLLCLAVQNFFQQVVENEAIVAGELFYQLRAVGSSLKRQCRELQSRDPAFRSLFERCDIVRR